MSKNALFYLITVGFLSLLYLLDYISLKRDKQKEEKSNNSKKMEEKVTENKLCEEHIKEGCDTKIKSLNSLKGSFKNGDNR